MGRVMIIGFPGPAGNLHGLVYSTLTSEASNVLCSTTCPLRAMSRDADRNKQGRESPASAVAPRRYHKTVEQLLKVGSCWSPSFSPDASRLAFITSLTGIPQVWTVSAASGWPFLVTTLDDPVTKVCWSPDGAWLALSAASGGGMNQQIYLVRPDGTDLRCLSEGDSTNSWLGRWIYGGKKLAIVSNRRDRRALDLHFIDTASGIWELVAKTQGIGIPHDISPDGSRALLFRGMDRAGGNLYLLDIDRGDEELLTPGQGDAQYSDALFSGDGASVYVGTNACGERMALVRIDLVPGRPVTLLTARDDAELQECTLVCHGTKAVLLWNVAGCCELEVLDLSTRQRTPIVHHDVATMSALTRSPEGRNVAVEIKGAAAPRDIWVLDVETHCLRQVTHSPHPGVDLTALTRPDLVRFTAHDDLPLSGWLYRPGGAQGPGPVVVSFHGGPASQETPAFNGTYQALLQHGIAVFAPNVRGSSGFGKTFTRLDDGALRFNSIKDIESCVAYLVTAGIADPARVGVMGVSYGGFMAMSGLSRYPSLFAAGVTLFGIVNFETFFAHTEPWMAEISKVEYGDPVTQLDMLRELSPIQRVDHIVSPTLIVHGANDTNVPPVEAEQLGASLERRGIPVEYMLFLDEGHGLKKFTNRVRATLAVTDWFQHYL